MKIDNHRGASEVVGAMILIAVIGTVVSIAGVAILSQPPPEKIPSLNAEIDFVGNKVMITHNGGDTLKKDQMAIMVDGVDRTNSFVLKDDNGWSDWMIGDTLDYTGDSAPPGSVQIIYKGGSSGHVLLSLGNTSTLAGSIPTGTPVVTTPPVTTLAPPVVTADFSGTPTSGYLPLAVQFTDLSTGPIDLWSWAFGDGNTSSVPSPLYTYPNAGNYTVILLVTNSSYGVTSTATKVNYTQVQSFAEYVSNESVFVYGTKLIFRGYAINGENSTIVVMGPLLSTELDGGAKINVSTIYVDGYVDLGSSNVALGYQPKPGNTYINGYLKSQADLYGEINLTGDATLSGARVHGNVSLDGDLILNWNPNIDANSNIYYTGTIIVPGSWVDTSRCIHVDTLPGFTIPDLPIPSTKNQTWYDERGYVSEGALTSNLKVFADSYTSTSWVYSATNIVIVARTGDITLTGLGGSTVSGVLFAPNGRVTFEGGTFEGVVIAKDGFYVTSGGTTVTFKNMDDYFSSSDDYPF